MEAERRQVTVLFADMVGFTAFSEWSGEEAAFTLMQSLAKLMEDAVREQGGVVQSFTGDGIMAVFGAPVAYRGRAAAGVPGGTGDPRRVKTAGGDLEAKHGARPELRIGINSGPAVVGKVQGGFDAGITVLGDTVNFAARLQALADPSSVVMSEATQRLVEGLVEARLLASIRSKASPMRRRRIGLTASESARARFDAKIHRGLTRYVGRDRELEKLERGLERDRRAASRFSTSSESPASASRASCMNFLGRSSRIAHGS